MKSDESGIVTAEKWASTIDAQEDKRNHKIAAGPDPLCVRGWQDPSTVPESMFDKTGKHAFALQMRLARAGLTTNIYR
jgi:hypothetical protein